MSHEKFSSAFENPDEAREAAALKRDAAVVLGNIGTGETSTSSSARSTTRSRTCASTPPGHS